jgi:hypothetical protein
MVLMVSVITLIIIMVSMFAKVIIELQVTLLAKDICFLVVTIVTGVHSFL